MSDAFTNHVIKVTIVRCAREFGFSEISETALSILTEIVIDFIYSTAELAQEITTHSGRTDTNGYDIFFALKHKINYSPEILIDFLNNHSEKIIPYESSVSPYPEPTINSFYKNQLSSKKIPPFRFRRYLPVQSKKESREVPQCYPDYPPDYMYKDSVSKSESSLTEMDIEKQRSKEQKTLQMQIENLNKNLEKTRSQTIDIGSHLKLILSSEIKRTPQSMGDPTFVMNGHTAICDPEHMIFAQKSAVANDDEFRPDDDDEDESGRRRPIKRRK